MYYQNIDFEKSCAAFLNEMKVGLRAKSSLKMIPTYIDTEKKIDFDENIIVMDAGGTNFRVALVSFDNEKQPVLNYYKKYPMPGTSGPITKEEFYGTITGYLSPIIDKSSKIGFCFSFPTEILPNLDGKLIQFNKEVKISGMEGEIIGNGILNALERGGYSSNRSIVVLNDTVATLLSSKITAHGRIFDSYIGFIFGTGTNTCYIEKNSNIVKNSYIKNKPGSSIINIESGGYAKIDRSSFDNTFDSQTEAPGTQLYEKMVSGAYQGDLFLTILKQAAKDGLFSRNAVNAIVKVGNLESKDLDNYCYYPYGNNVLSLCVYSENDRLTLYYMIDEFLERITKLVAINLTAVMLKTGKGRNPCKPICITAEGTTFYKSKFFKTKLDYNIKKFTNEQYGIYCDFVKSKDPTLIGAAVAGLLSEQ